MKKKIPVGIEFYKDMIKNDYYYVDKTLLIRDILDGGAAVSLFTRPRRFGKTLALTMLQAYFEDERDDRGEHIDNSRYFTGKKIAGCGEKYLARSGQFPVIFLTLKSAKQPTYEMAYRALKNTVIEEFNRHQYILKSAALTPNEKEKFLAIVSETADEGDYATALSFLCACLKKAHGKNTVILIDEYDVPLENAYFAGFYDKMISFIRSLFESAFKINQNLEFAVITGCLRISRESIFTGLNNLHIVSILRDDYAEGFGFTPAEVRKMLTDYQVADQIENAEKWYDGYLFGNTEIYNPWSIINFVMENTGKTEVFPKPYWANTSSNSIVRDLIENADSDAKAEIEKLIAGETIEKPVHEDITYEDIHESQDNLWNFLFFTGYLKKTGQRQERRTIYIRMAIPNEEVAYIYENTIRTWFDQKIRASDRKPLYKALLSGDCPALENILKKQLVESISFYDEAEQFYPGFMVGMLSGLGNYHLVSNRESGDGRADLMMIPADEKDPVIILELKKADRFPEMENKCKAALCQIEEKHYDAEQKEIGYERYIKYGVCFCRKTCKIKAKTE